MKLRSLSISLIALACVASAQTYQTQPQASPQTPPIYAPVKGGPAPLPPQGSNTFIWVQAPKVKVGAPAPTFLPSRWVKGGPVVISGGKVTVINFWASWSPPCKETFEPVADLYRKFKGKAEFVGVSVFERPSEVRTGAYAKNVESFVRTQGKDLPYSVALDDADGTLAKTWLEGAGQPIPVTYIVDRTGRIAWIGHPLADLSEVLPKVISGKYDTDKAAQEQHVQIVVEGELRDLMIPIQSAMRAGHGAEAVAAIDRAIAKNQNLASVLAPAKFQNLLESDEKEAYAYAKSLADGAFKENPMGLNILAWYIVADDAKLKHPDYATALAIAKRASELTQHSDPYILDTYALALFRTGDRAKALELQTRAVALGEVKKGIDPKILAEMRGRLAKFKKSSETP